MAPLHGNEDLLREVAHEVAEGRTEVALIGMTGIALSMWSAVSELGADVSIFDPEVEATGPCMRPWSELKERSPDLVVIASDERKERLLHAAADILDGHRPLPRVVLFGLAHQELPDPLFEELERPALVPSYATGHPYTRRHLYDCLRAAAANGREGAIVELGAFKGGTSVWLAKAARALGIAAKVIAFDAWMAFPSGAQFWISMSILAATFVI